MTDAGDKIFFIDNDYTIQKASRKLCQKIGLEDGNDLVGKKCYVHFFKLENPCGQCPVSRSITFQTVVEEDIQLDPAGTGIRHAIATPLMDDNNKVRQIIVDCLGDTISSVDQKNAILTAQNFKAKPLPQLPIEEIGEGVEETLCALLFDKDLSIIVANHWHDAPGFGNGENLVGRNLFTVAPFYNQAPVRKKIESFIGQQIGEHAVFRTKADIYSAHWLDHHLYRLVGQSKINAYLIISKISRNDAIVGSRALMVEKVTMLSRFASRISHDIKNPLALISTSIEFLRSDLAKVNSLDGVYELVDYMDQVQGQVSRVVDILDTVNALKVHSMDTISETDAAELLDRSATITLLSKPFPENDVQINIAGPLPPIHVSEINMERAFSELFRSLLKQAGESGQLNINLAYIGELDEIFVFKIHTNIKQSTILDLDEMMAEFFASSNRFNISNLGLAIAYATIINHSGEMEVLTLDSGELEILIKLPRAPQALL